MITEAIMESFFESTSRSHNELKNSVNGVLDRLSKDEPEFFKMYLHATVAANGKRSAALVMQGIAVFYHLLKTQEEIAKLGDN